MSLPPTATRLMRWQDRHRTLTDILIAVVILVATVLTSVEDVRHPSVAPAGTWVYGLGLVTCALCTAGIALRRRAPVLAWALVTFAPPIHLLALDRLTTLSLEGVLRAGRSLMLVIVLVGTPVVLSALASHRRMIYAWLTCLISTTTMVATDIAVTPTSWRMIATTIPLFALANVIGTLLGIIMRIQHLQLTTVEERVAREALAREQTAMLAASNERSRIAREMHDVVAHSLAVMITMADGASAAVERNPAMAKQALDVLAETGRSALADTRRLVGVLRDDPGASSAPGGSTAQAEQAGHAGHAAQAAQAARTAATLAAAPPAPMRLSAPGGTRGRRRPGEPEVRDLPVPEFAPPGTVAPSEPSAPIADLRRQATAGADRSTGDVPTAPAPESADLAVLVERFRAAGVPISYEWTGNELPADKGLQLTLFRIAQESMTNILRYAPTTKSVKVSVSRYLGTVVLTVDNDAAPGTKPVHGSGKGLIGMRERAAVYGGTVDAGPTDAGWRVRAVLRWDESDEGASPWQIPT